MDVVVTAGFDDDLEGEGETQLSVPIWKVLLPLLLVLLVLILLVLVLVL
jgi:hypothetical protein